MGRACSPEGFSSSECLRRHSFRFLELISSRTGNAKREWRTPMPLLATKRDDNGREGAGRVLRLTSIYTHTSMNKMLAHRVVEPHLGFAFPAAI